MGQRRIAARLREEAISLVCGVLAKVFEILSQNLNSSFLDLPAGARVAIIKPCCLGDVVLTTPLIQVVSQARPDLELDFVVSNWAKPIVAQNPRLSQIIDTGFSGSSFNTRQYLTLVGRLRKRKYQAAIVLDRSPWLALLPWLAGIRLRAGLDSAGRGFALNVRARLLAKAAVRPEAEIYLEVARSIGLDTNGASLEFYSGEAARQRFEQKAAQVGLDLAQPIAVIHPGGGQNPDTTVLSKRWPAQNFGEIAHRLLQSGWQVVVIGAQGERAAVKVVAGAIQNSPGFFNLAEQLDISESGALFKRASLFVGNDTGLMHLAAACGTTTIAIFGPSSPIAYGPYTKKGKAVSPLKRVALEGLPLTEYQALSVAEGGIASVTIEQVWEAIKSK